MALKVQLSDILDAFSPFVEVEKGVYIKEKDTERYMAGEEVAIDVVEETCKEIRKIKKMKWD